LGWSTKKGDVDALVGYDGNSYSYRDVGPTSRKKEIGLIYADVCPANRSLH